VRLRPFQTTVRAAAVLAVLAATALAGAAHAQTPTAADGTSVTAHHGIKPQHPAIHVQATTASSRNLLTVRSSASTGVVSPNPRVYLVFWGSQWSSDPAAVAPDLQNLFAGLYGSQDTWGTIMSQYCEGVAKGTSNCGTKGTHITHPASSPLAGAWFDNSAAAPANATAAQIATEASRAAAHFGNTTQTPNLNAQYVVVSATGTHPDGFPNSGFCAWHDKTSSSYGTLAYTNLPYVPDLGAGACTTLTDGRMLSGIESTETHEYAETVTDFWPSIGWNGGNGEIGDECENLDAFVPLSTGSFDLQGLWSNSANKCATHG
jgi:serine protease